jgi:hypothetical protein
MQLLVAGMKDDIRKTGDSKAGAVPEIKKHLYFAYLCDIITVYDHIQKEAII